MGSKSEAKKIRDGYFGASAEVAMGGRFVPETLQSPLANLETFWTKLQKDRRFWRELDDLLRHYVGRPTPLYFAANLSRTLGVRVYLKREDLCHTGAHKINNALGQALLAKRMGKTRVIAETGAGQHGVATATAAALLGLTCEVFMGEEDMRRQAPNVERMNILGARVVPVRMGSRTLKDAMNEALRDWVANVRSTHYIIGSVAGPHPYPSMVRQFQSVIGREVRKQLRSQVGRALPDHVIACVGGGSNAMGIFSEFVREKRVVLHAVEAGGEGLDSGRHAASLLRGKPGVLHGSRSLYLQDEAGQIVETHSVAAGLDYPGVGPEVAALYQSSRLTVGSVTDEEALAGFSLLARSEGIIPALESSHAVAYLSREARHFKKRAIVVLNCSGRGDKDLATIQAQRGHP